MKKDPAETDAPISDLAGDRVKNSAEKDPETNPYVNWLIGLPILVFFILLIWWLSKILLLIIVLLYTLKIMSDKATKEINKRVLAKPEGVPLNNHADEKAGTLAGRILQADHHVKIEIIDANSLPEVSALSRSILENARFRAPAIRRIRLRLLYFLSFSTALLATCYFLYSNYLSSAQITGGAIDPVIIEGSIMAFGIAWHAKKSIAYQNNFKGAVRFVFALTDIKTFMKENPYSSAETVRSTSLSFHEACWIIALLVNVYISYSVAPGISKIIFCGLAVTIIVVYIFQLQTQRRKIEKLYPYRPPFNLLLLRVFGGRDLYNFLSHTGHWNLVGTINNLDGFDTVGHKFGDITNYIKGRVQDSIIEDDEELNEALKKFSKIPIGSDLSFPQNSIQCTNDTWKKAIHQLMDEADVVIIDLSGLSEKNQGVAYELNKLFNEKSITKILMVIDHTTDLAILQNLLHKAWEQMPESSPNKRTALNTIRLFDTGSSNKLQENKPDPNWETVVAICREKDAMAGMLLDAATGNNAQLITTGELRDDVYTHWTGLRCSNRKRKLWNYSCAAFLLAAILYSIFH